jgi:carbon monoxide dehydrogenase subunit G
MDITGQYRIAAPRQAVWDALNDPRILEKCIPGCESLEQVDESHMNGRIKAAIGPVRASFDTKIHLQDSHPPERYTLVGEAKAGAAGFGRGTANVSLTEDAEITVLDYTADLKVGGKLAQVGSRLVEGATRKTADEFFAAFSRELDQHAVRTDLPAAKKSGTAGRWIALAVAALAVLLLLWFLLG